jgi:hypothetical protein
VHCVPGKDQLGTAHLPCISHTFGFHVFFMRRHILIFYRYEVMRQMIMRTRVTPTCVMHLVAQSLHSGGTDKVGVLWMGSGWRGAFWIRLVFWRVYVSYLCGNGILNIDWWESEDFKQCTWNIDMHTSSIKIVSVSASNDWNHLSFRRSSSRVFYRFK